VTASHRVIWAGLTAAVVALLAVATFDQSGSESDTERIQRLTASYACPVCDGESVAESNAAVAATIREFISDEVAAGASDQEIRNALIRGYGVQVLLNPPAEGLTQLLWILPVVLLVTGTVAVVTIIDRNRIDAPVTDGDRELVEAALARWRAEHAPEGGTDQ
jgi:cytochrome c-type biogenesis protein CcmH